MLAIMLPKIATKPTDWSLEVFAKWVPGKPAPVLHVIHDTAHDPAIKAQASCEACLCIDNLNEQCDF